MTEILSIIKRRVGEGGEKHGYYVRRIQQLLRLAKKPVLVTDYWSASNRISLNDHSLIPNIRCCLSLRASYGGTDPVAACRLYPNACLIHFINNLHVQGVYQSFEWQSFAPASGACFGI